MAGNYDVFSHTGMRENNEDFALVKTVGGTTILVVCDGVGGSAKGEVASKAVATNIVDFITRQTGAESYEKHVQQAIIHAQETLNELALAGEGSHNMATTLTLAVVHPGKAVLAHMGDSRIYFIRGSGIIYQTADHSLVGELLRGGVITETEAATHPKKNVITRYLVAGQQQPDPEIVSIPEILPGDQLFLCTDGVLESVSNTKLLQVLAAKNTVSAKMKELAALCAASSRDNYTAVLLEYAAD